MKFVKALLMFILCTGCVISNNITAQVISGGTVRYQQINKYIFKTTGNPEWDEYAKTLPTEGKFERMLYFSPQQSLYEVAEKEKEAMSEKEMKAMYMASYGKPPKSEKKKIFCDLDKNKETAEVEFMSRIFLIESDIESKDWKLSGTQKEVVGYVCMSAELEMNGLVITAWFSPEIPYSFGPADYFGLPGLVLAVELNGEMALMAIDVELNLSDIDILVKPKNGKKVKQKEFDEIVEEKTEEFLKSGGKEEKYGSKGYNKK